MQIFARYVLLKIHMLFFQKEVHMNCPKCRADSKTLETRTRADLSRKSQENAWNKGEDSPLLASSHPIINSPCNLADLVLLCIFLEILRTSVRHLHLKIEIQIEHKRRVHCIYQK